MTVPAAPWHALAATTVSRRLGVEAERGLSGTEAERRRRTDGPNEIARAGGRGIAAIAVAQIADPMLLLLAAAAIVARALGDVEDAIAIVAIVFINTAIGFVQELRAERAIRALGKMAASRAQVVRDGVVMTVPERDVVRGDVVLLEAGALVPADVRLVQAAALRIDEALLTGEPHPVDKEADVLCDAAAPLADRNNIAFKGTMVTAGRGRGIVVAVAGQSAIGTVAGLLSETRPPPTPLQRRLHRLGRDLTALVVAICAFVFLFGLLRGEPAPEMLLTAVSLAVAAVPEALPVVVNLALALGALQMARQHVLVRRLAAVETLGAITYICTDKTGTLTENRLAAEVFVTSSGRRGDVPAGLARLEPWWTLLRCLALSNDVVRDAQGAALGDPTEVALERAARGSGAIKEELLAAAPRVAELPFDATRKRMTTVHRSAEGGAAVVAFTKGAPETVLPRCAGVLTASGTVPCDRAALRSAAETLARDGYRVLAFATRTWPNEPDIADPDQLERDLTFLGLVGLVDPLRPEAAAAVDACRAAGIVPVMITGDHVLTARRIGAQLRIASPEALVMSGGELAEIESAAFANVVRDVRVYARVDPTQKLRIVEALQRAGETVAMTGDGVNDAPALRRADVGIAMGRVGTDIARDASHVVLTDDNFASIVGGVREGRRILDNIRTFAKFVLAGNAGEILTVLVPPLVGLPLALLPIHILWINLVTDSLPGLALAAEAPQPGTMQSVPRGRQEPVLPAHGWWYVLAIGAAIAAVSIGVEAAALDRAPRHWQTMVFTVLTLAQLFQALAVRLERAPALGRQFFGNRALIAAVGFTCLLQAAAIYLPAAQLLLHTAPLDAGELAWCTAAAATVFGAVELFKAIGRRAAPETLQPKRR